MQCRINVYILQVRWPIRDIGLMFKSHTWYDFWTCAGMWWVYVVGKGMRLGAKRVHSYALVLIVGEQMDG